MMMMMMMMMMMAMMMMMMMMMIHQQVAPLLPQSEPMSETNGEWRLLRQSSPCGRSRYWNGDVQCRIKCTRRA